jgi:hypothetical protein
MPVLHSSKGSSVAASSFRPHTPEFRVRVREMRLNPTLADVQAFGDLPSRRASLRELTQPRAPARSADPRPARRDGPRRRLFEGRLWLAPAAEGRGNNIASSRAASVSESHLRPVESPAPHARVPARARTGGRILRDWRLAAWSCLFPGTASFRRWPATSGCWRAGRRGRLVADELVPRLRVLATFERSRRTVGADSSRLRAKDRLGEQVRRRTASP